MHQATYGFFLHFYKNTQVIYSVNLRQSPVNVLLSNVFVIYVLPATRCVMSVLHLIWLSISLLRDPESGVRG